MVLDDFRLEGKVALVTGGGTGIGSGILKGLAEAGADIACVYNAHEPTEVEAYVKSLGRRFLAIHADVAQMNDLQRIMDETLQEYGRLDILVNNAGICPRASALEYTEEMWDRIIQINEKAVFFLSQLAARQFLKQGSRGKIINLASMMSFLGGFNTTAYTASKHAVQGLTRASAFRVMWRATAALALTLAVPSDSQSATFVPTEKRCARAGSAAERHAAERNM